MQRAMKWVLSLLGSIAFLCGGFVILHGSLPPASINAWLPAGNLTAARAGAASILLQDGRLLITGGNGASGALATTEILDPSAGFTAGPPMNFARAHHVAVLLQDGRVLVAGGTDASGAASQTAELFDPNSNTFTSAAGVLSSARENHAAAPLPDGRVIILGGWDGTTQQSQSGPGGLNVLASTDIFDPATGAVSSGPAMTSPRMNFTATTALDGSVVAIGGTDGVNDLASIDVLIPGAGAFALSGAQLTTARQGHLAFLLPHNGNILVVGGTSSGTAISSAELYTPWTGATSVTGAMASARSGATGSPLFQTVLTAPVGIDGALLVAGGLDASSPPNTLQSAEVYGFATIKTDQTDYPPGVPVTITGSGWQPGEVVQMSLVEVPDLDGDSPIPLTATADANGNIINTSFSTNIEDANIHFTLTAVGVVSQAQTTFTDASAPNGSVTLNPITVQVNNSITATISVSSHGSCTPADGTTINWTHTGTGSFDSTTCTLSSLSCSVHYTPSSTAIPNPQTVTGTSPATGGANGCSNTPFSANLSVFGTADHLAFGVQPSNTQAGSSISPAVTVQVLDSNNNLVANSSASITVTILSGTPTTGGPGTLNGTTTASAINGVATFSDLSIDKVGTGYKLAASGGAPTGATSNSFDITPAPASQLVFTVQPGGAVAGSPLSPQPQVSVEDQFGNVITTGTGSGVPITLAITSGTGTAGAALSCTANPVTASSGVASFANCTISLAGTNYQLHASTTIQGTPYSMDSGAFTITSANVGTSTTVTSSVNPSVFGQSITFTAKAQAASGTTDPTGTVTFTVDGSPGAPIALGLCSPAVAGTACASTSTSSLTVSSSPHSVSAQYNHTGNFNDSNGSLSGGQTVNQADTTTVVSLTGGANPSLVGDSLTFQSAVAAVSPGGGTLAGNLSFYDGGSRLSPGTLLSGPTAINGSGLASFSTSSLTHGMHTILACYAGNSNYNSSSGTLDQTVNYRATSTTVTNISPGSVALGVSTTVTVKVMDTSPGTASNPSGTVSLTTSGSGTFGTCTLAQGANPLGTVSCDVSYTPSGTVSGASRNDTITASFTASDNTHENSSDATGKSVTVTKRSTSTTVTNLNPAGVVVAQSTTVTVTVVDTDSGTVSNPGGTVSVGTTGVGTFGTCTLAQGANPLGTVSCDVSYTPSSAAVSPQSITASFTATDSVHKDSADNTGKSLTVNRRSTSTTVGLSPASVVTGQSSSVTVTVSDTESAGTKQYPTGNVSISSSEGTDVFTNTPCTLVSTATAGVSSCSVNIKPVHVATSPHTITASFGETDVHLASSGHNDLTVSKDATTTVVTSSANPITLGQSVSFTATVTANAPGSGTPTGSVQFYIDGVVFGSSVALSGGSATSGSTTTLTAGQHNITAVYSGDSDYFASNNTASPYVENVTYNFSGLLDPYAPPGVRGYKVNSAIPLKWQYADVNNTVVNSSNANPVVQIYAAVGCGDTSTGDVLSIVASGNSGYQYDTTTNTWQFNWKTGGPIGAGCYVIYIKSQLTGQTNGPFPIQLVR